MGPLIGVHLLGRLLVHFNLLPDRSIWINRRTGLVTFPARGGKVEVPFDEFDPYLMPVTSYSGRTTYQLQLVHRYDDHILISQTEGEGPWEAEADWEFWQHYMDTSRPLPDIPLFEPVRSLDPVTAEHDRKSGRPPYYWRNMPEEVAQAMKKAARQAASSYPWGQDRQSAERSGWRPSGGGEGKWRHDEYGGDTQEHREPHKEDRGYLIGIPLVVFVFITIALHI